MGLLHTVAPLLDKDMQSDYFDGQAFRGYVDQGVERLDARDLVPDHTKVRPLLLRTKRDGSINRTHVYTHRKLIYMRAVPSGGSRSGVQ